MVASSSMLLPAWMGCDKFKLPHPIRISIPLTCFNVLLALMGGGFLGENSMQIWRTFNNPIEGMRLKCYPLLISISLSCPCNYVKKIVNKYGPYSAPFLKKWCLTIPIKKKKTPPNDTPNNFAKCWAKQKQWLHSSNFKQC